MMRILTKTSSKGLSKLEPTVRDADIPLTLTLLQTPGGGGRGQVRSVHHAAAGAGFDQGTRCDPLGTEKSTCLRS